MADPRRNGEKSLGYILGRLIILAIVVTVIRPLLETLSFPEMRLITIVLTILTIVVYIVWKDDKKHKLKKAHQLAMEKVEAIQCEIAKVNISDRREDYLIENKDYRRGNDKENLYRKKFFLTLLRIFENQCAKCRSVDNGIDLDHFFLSKNEGGCFIMRHKDGYLVNNAIPLCQRCNRIKSDNSYKAFFTQEEILRLFQRNAELTKVLNETEELKRLFPDANLDVS